MDVQSFKVKSQSEIVQNVRILYGCKGHGQSLATNAFDATN